jgi:FKBP-type peptidyl-prolyl cis-trans isomerase FkpA
MAPNHVKAGFFAQQSMIGLFPHWHRRLLRTMRGRMTQIVSRIAPVLAPVLIALLACAPTPSPAQSAPAAGIIKLPLQPQVGPELRSCSAKTASGLGYAVLRQATGPKPGKSDFVLIGYIGYLATTGQVFDQNQGTPLSLDSVIPGFAEGLQLMPRGSVYRLCVPAALGYGATGAGDAVPANSDLVFQIELIDSKTAAEVDAMRKAQPPAEAAPPPAH